MAASAFGSPIRIADSSSKDRRRIASAPGWRVNRLSPSWQKLVRIWGLGGWGMMTSVLRRAHRFGGIASSPCERSFAWGSPCKDFSVLLSTASANFTAIPKPELREIGTIRASTSYQTLSFFWLNRPSSAPSRATDQAAARSAELGYVPHVAD